MNQLNYKQIFLTGVIFRLILFIFLIYVPIAHSSFGNIGPFIYQTFSDLGFYQEFGKYYGFIRLEGGTNFPYVVDDTFTFERFFNDYKNLIFLKFNDIYTRYPGFIFPLILKLTLYSKYFPFLMGVTIFFTELLSFYFWSNYFFKKIHPICALFFCFLPIPLIYGFIHSIDIIFYFLSSILYFHIINYIKIKPKLLSIILIALVFSRPAAIAILLVYLINSIISKSSKKIIILSSLSILISLFYYAPYFIIESEIMNKNYSDFNINFLNDNLLLMFNKFFIKIYYLMGLYESTNLNSLTALVKTLTGFIFLFGYICSFFKKNTIDLIYVNLIIIPVCIFLFPSQRYMLPISPILYMYLFISFLNIYNFVLPKKD